MGHSHGHGPPPRVPPAVARRLTFAVVPFAVATLAGLVVLWPGAPRGLDPSAALDTERVPATVTSSDEVPCGDLAQGQAFVCYDITVRIEAGADEGDTVTFSFAGTTGSRSPEPGDAVFVGSPPGDLPPNVEPTYFFLDYQRSAPLLALTAIFVVVVVALSRWRGLAALAGLAISLFVIVKFLLPAILQGESPLLVSIFAASAIMFPTLYLAHGVNVRTTTAVLGTLSSLALTGALAVTFVELTRFTGLSSEEATFLQVSADQINLTGLLLGGIIIGSLGVLDDVTVTQASAVWELRQANPAYSPRQLYSSAVRIGRDHIASTVNTLVLAYVGASLPLMILFTLASRPFTEIITTEIVAEEIVRTLVGSIGLVASVPITTGLAALAAGRAARDRAPTEGDEDWERPPREKEWRE